MIIKDDKSAFSVDLLSSSEPTRGASRRTLDKVVSVANGTLRRGPQALAENVHRVIADAIPEWSERVFMDDNIPFGILDEQLLKNCESLVAFANSRVTSEQVLALEGILSLVTRWPFMRVYFSRLEDRDGASTLGGQSFISEGDVVTQLSDALSWSLCDNDVLRQARQVVRTARVPGNLSKEVLLLAEYFSTPEYTLLVPLYMRTIIQNFYPDLTDEKGYATMNRIRFYILRSLDGLFNIVNGQSRIKAPLTPLGLRMYDQLLVDLFRDSHMVYETVDSLRYYIQVALSLKFNERFKAEFPRARKAAKVYLDGVRARGRGRYVDSEMARLDLPDRSDSSSSKSNE